MNTSSDILISVDAGDVRTVDTERVAAVQRVLPARETVSELAEVFGLLADPGRLQLMASLLEGGELCVCDAAAAAGMGERRGTRDGGDPGRPIPRFFVVIVVVTPGQPIGFGGERRTLRRGIKELVELTAVEEHAFAALAHVDHDTLPLDLVHSGVASWAAPQADTH